MEGGDLSGQGGLEPREGNPEEVKPSSEEAAETGAAISHAFSLQVAEQRFQPQQAFQQQQQGWNVSSPPLFLGGGSSQQQQPYHNPLLSSQQQPLLGWSGSSALHPSFGAAGQQHRDSLGVSQQAQVPYDIQLLLQQQGHWPSSNYGLLDQQQHPGVDLSALLTSASGPLPNFTAGQHPSSQLTSPYYPPAGQSLLGGGAATMHTNPAAASSFSTMENHPMSAGSALSQLYSVASTSSNPFALQASLPLSDRLPSTAPEKDLQQQRILEDMLRSQAAILRRQNFGGIMDSSQQQQHQQQSPHELPQASSHRKLISMGTGASGEGVAHSATGQITFNKKKGKEANKPKRPLSAYNVFFKEERQKLLSSIPAKEEGVGDDESDEEDGGDKKPSAATRNKNPKRSKPHGKISFESMAKIIGQRWKAIESDAIQKRYYQDLADRDKDRYRAELEVWKRKQSEALTEQLKQLERSVDERTKEQYFESAGGSPP